MERFTKKIKGRKVARKTINPPTEKELIFCISLYFGLPPKFTRYNILFRYYLRQIYIVRHFDKRIKKEDKAIFWDYIKSHESKINLSRKYYNHTRKGQSIINYYLHLLVDEIKKDYNSGTLTVQPYEPPKRETKRDIIRKLNAYYQKRGINKRLPLRKKSNRELIKDYQKHIQEMKKRTTSQ